MKTTKKALEILQKKMDEVVLEYRKYLKEYNKEHDVESGNKIKEIIELHRQGVSKQEIVNNGYNKFTVRDQIRLFEKGKRVTKTTIAKFLPPKEKK